MEMLANKLADSRGKDYINEHIAKYGKLKSLFFKDGQIRASLLLNGLEDREITISCASVNIAEDGSEISLAGFSSNLPCVEQALNDFCTRSFPVNSKGVQIALAGIRKLLF
ncbi:hypothetical protein [Desulfovibrio sp.]|uniref:hypothetical protein n=1 Tax=Desulfovibrio sp. TaxID=885 RepID=UPI0023D2F463|nr:hypothetical protein [Desulfovibrio sp.]MDE7240366.1 hypothetical protein [Desulfovibrio sp.]